MARWKRRNVTLLAIACFLLLCIRMILITAGVTTLLAQDPQSNVVSLPTIIQLDDLVPIDKTVSFEGKDDLLILSRDLMRGKFCDEILGGRWNTNRTRMLVNITLDCNDVFENSPMGTGNYACALYAARMASQTLGNVDFQLQCADADSTKQDLVLPWLTGYFPGTRHTLPLEERRNPTVEEACTHFNMIGLGYALPVIRYEMRRMAVALVGVPHEQHPSAAFVKALRQNKESILPLGSRKLHLVFDPDSPPLFPDVELDDAVLHFRCGDLIDAKHKSFGFMKFHSFSRHLSPAVQSIGIITQPFNDDVQLRSIERVPHKLERCRLVVTAFQSFLQEQFPKARVSIRNQESIALTYARVVMANQTVIAISTFGVIPAIATFGQGFIREPDFAKSPNRFLLHPNIETLAENVHLVKEPRLMAAKLQKMWGEDGSKVLEWFQSSIDA